MPNRGCCHPENPLVCCCLGLAVELSSKAILLVRVSSCVSSLSTASPKKEVSNNIQALSTTRLDVTRQYAWKPPHGKQRLMIGYYSSLGYDDVIKGQDKYDKRQPTLPYTLLCYRAYVVRLKGGESSKPSIASTGNHWLVRARYVTTR